MHPINSPVLKCFVQATLAVAFVSVSCAISRGGDLPDLARLKLAAEAGDPAAQYSYGWRIASANPKEQFSLFLRSAEQGYAPAQDALGGLYGRGITYDLKNKTTAARESVRWSSRAAYQGFAASQRRLGSYYETGVCFPKDPVVAYMWNQIAVDNPNSTAGDRMMAKLNRDRIIATTSSENIKEGQRRAAEFTYPSQGSLNPIEIELLVSELKLLGVFHLNNRISAAVNSVRFYPGETKEIKVDDHLIQLSCISIEEKTAHFKITGTESLVTLELKR